MCGELREVTGAAHPNFLPARCPEQIRAHDVYGKEGPRFCGVFLFQVSVMLNKSDFFQEQVKKCNGLAERASSQTDRRFWLGMAQRWERMLEAGDGGTLEVEVEPRFERPIMKKRANRWVRRQAA